MKKRGKEMWNIADGWLNYIRNQRPAWASKTREELATTRAAICQTCPHLKQKSIKIFADHYCSKCGCLFPMMAYAKDKDCPLGLWPVDPLKEKLMNMIKGEK
jgi:hypothetical protein